MKYIILGDIHLGKGVGIGKPGVVGTLNSRIQDQINLLNWTRDKAQEIGAETIFVTGDVYEEPRPHPTLIRHFMLWLKSCEKIGITVHIVVGNHDIIKSGSYTSSALDIVPALELPYAKTYKDIETIHHDGISFTFLPYRDRRIYEASSPEEGLKKVKKELENEPETIPEGNIRVLIGHLAIEGSLYVGDEIDDMLNELFCPIDMFLEYDYVWMGHIHKPQVRSKSKPRVAHIGSMDRSDFHRNEIDHDKILVVINTDDPDLFHEIKIPTRPLRKVKITVPVDKDTTDFIINELHAFDKVAPLKDAIVRIEVQLDGQQVANADRSKVVKYIYDKLNAHYVCNFSESRNISVIEADTETLFSNDMNTKTAINTYFDSLDIKEENKNIALQIAMDCYEIYRKKHESVKN